MNTEVSFITTVKNAEAFIIETIESVINQTMKNWEFIIVDDGSTDDTLKIIKNITKKDNRIKVIETSGIGRGRSLNLAIENSKGNFIANIDADDPCHPQRAEIEMEVLQKNKMYSLVATKSNYINGKKDVNWTLYDLSEKKNIEIIDITSTREKPFIKEPINHSSVMFRRDDLLEVGKYDESRELQFDAELWNRISFQGYKMGLIPMKLASKRIHSNQSFEIGNRKKYLSSALELNKRKIKELKISPIYYIYIYTKYMYGLLPKSIREIIKSISH